ncbi:unnamed protein product [Oncorhynchus mykiss]|uniref:26S proteasome non-ATPase regulatory subunit 4 n=1 Tax=Oncorhynchus mykiss TaxID=8022 RepID=A0A060VP93_ONCMY|nr:unnamed protein product [Oncorhynchus mykiss]
MVFFHAAGYIPTNHMSCFFSPIDSDVLTLSESDQKVFKMGLESTMVCVDNSEYMRNGDFLPTRLQAQQDAVNIVCHSKTRANPENNVGLISMANNCEVLTTLTPDSGRILSKLHAIQPKGKICFCTGIRVAHLALKHRQGKNHKMRIIAFVGSPVEDSDKDLVKMAKRLKKEKVNVDIINFGEEDNDPHTSRLCKSYLTNKESDEVMHQITWPPQSPNLNPIAMVWDELDRRVMEKQPISAQHIQVCAFPNHFQSIEFTTGGLPCCGNISRMINGNRMHLSSISSLLAKGLNSYVTKEFNTEKLTAFINTLNGKEGTGSHLVTVPPGPSLADALLSSPILAGEGGSMMGLGASDFEFGVDPSADPELALALRVSMEEQRQRQEEEARQVAVASAADVTTADSKESEESEEALLKMSVSQPETGGAAVLPDFSNMTEEEQIAYAMRMSLAGEEYGDAMDTETATEEDDYDVMQDPEFLQSVLQNLPGVDPNNEAIRNAMGSLASQTGPPKPNRKKDEDKKK